MKKKSLKHLESVHDRKKPFKQNDASFSSEKGILKKHFRWVHERKKPLQFNTCEDFLVNKQSFNKHKESVHEDNQHLNQCNQCFFEN